MEYDEMQLHLTESNQLWNFYTIGNVIKAWDLGVELYYEAWRGGSLVL